MKSAKVMDISKPGTTKSSAAASARPVIVTNRVIVQDPMVKTEGEDAKKDETPTAAPAAKGKLVIAPLSDPSRTEDDAKENKAAAKEGLLDLPVETLEDAPEAEGLGDSEPDEPAAKDDVAVPEKPAKKDEDDKAEPEDTKVAEAVADADASAEEKPKKVTAKEEAENKAQEEISQLIEEKEYFLPINAAEHRRSLIVVVLGAVVILLLAAAWVNIALDAGLIDIPGVKPLTSFFG